MRIVIAPDKFKGSLTAGQAADAIEGGFRAVWPDATYVTCPMADGGEGTVDVFVAAGAERRSARVHGPLGDPVDAWYAVEKNTAIVEMATASGLALLPKDRYDPVLADTYGTGELLCAALDDGVEHIVVGIGGSATNDAGTGMLRRLGVRFLDARGDEIGAGAAGYERLEAIDLSHLDQRIARIRLSVASDVDNPLTGPHGASRTFALQKGADDAQIALLDRVLGRIADVAAVAVGKDVRDQPGAGAAGGLGFALLAFLHGKIEPGVELIARERGLPKLLEGAQLCATGEGKIDGQTLHGKTVYGVGKLAAASGVPVVAFAGAIDREAVQPLNILGITVRAIAPKGSTPEESMRRAGEFLKGAAAEFGKEVYG
ncbi:MAG: glycerate kinase [Candidatus Tumulicola sp.]